MALLSVLIQAPGRCLVPWTIFQADPSASFGDLFNTIASGSVRVIAPSAELAEATLERVLVGPCKESLSVVDRGLFVGDVCRVFGQFVRYDVVLLLQTHETSAPTARTNAFTKMIQSSMDLAAAAQKPFPDSVLVRTKKDELYNDLIAYLHTTGMCWKGEGNTHGAPFVRALRDALWYVDGHHHTLRESGNPVPPNMAKFMGYNKPELSKHRKRKSSNLDVQSLKYHASSLRGFLLSSWMKDDSWKTMREDVMKLSSSLEGYVALLVSKRKKPTDAGCSRASIGDSMHFQTLPLTENFSFQLQPLVDELRGKEYYTFVFVRDFAPSQRAERFRYIRNLEQGLPFHTILYTHSIGGSIGNYHFIWKIPEHANIDGLFTENQKVVERIKLGIPKYHDRALRQELISKCGRLVPGAKSYALREIYRSLTGMSKCID